MTTLSLREAGIPFPESYLVDQREDTLEYKSPSLYVLVAHCTWQYVKRVLDSPFADIDTQKIDAMIAYAESRHLSPSSYYLYTDTELQEEGISQDHIELFEQFLRLEDGPMD